MPLSFPAAGDRIGRFRIVSQLGAGGMGVVYSAQEENLGRLVALKVISPMFADDPEFRARFSREARALASLDSPHVVQVYAHGEEDGYLYIATQLIPDGDLGQMIARWGAAPVGKAMGVIEQVASGLADAHAAGLVHRDIKPANVLVRRRGSTVAAYLGDFGIARRLDAELTRLGSGVIGTPSYMAPELHGGASASVSSDLYSVGCLLWVTLTGSAPYVGTSEFEIVGGHISKPVPQLTGSSPLVEATNRILRLAMAKEPLSRYPTAASLRDEVRAAAQLTNDPAFMELGHRVGGEPAGPGAFAPASPPPPGRPAGPPARTPTPTPSGPVVREPFGTPTPPSSYAPQPGRSGGRSRKPVLVAAAVAAVLAIGGGVAAGLAAGGGGGAKGDDPATTPTDPGFADAGPDEILRTAQRSMRTLDSVHIDGSVVDDGMDLDVAMTVTSDGDCDGTIGVGDGSAALRSVDGQSWFKPDRAFWEQVGGGEQGAVDLLVSLQGGKWVVLDDAEAGDFSDLCDLNTLLEGDSSSKSPTNDGTDEVDGEPVVKVTTQETDGPATSYVSLADPHYVLRLDAGDSGALDFSDFDAATDITAPADDEIVDLSNLE